MEKAKRIKYLAQTCRAAMERWKELSEEDRSFLAHKVCELSSLSYEQVEKMKLENERVKSDLEERLADTEAALATYEAFLLENNLVAEYDQYLEVSLNDIFGKKTPSLTLVQ